MNAIGKIHEFEKFGSILGLERMNSLMAELGNPQDGLKYIHVAGTNGKGSTCKYIYEVLEAQGYRTGLYTSPFLEVFNERIEFDHRYISDSDLDEYTNRVLEKVKILTDRGEDSPTEFEVVTAVAFLYFKEKNADFVVLEVGLGGIGDSTNIIRKPLASVIASISFDHTDRLGKTIGEIAANKAGIIKPGCPVITSASSEEALDVFRSKAKECNSEYHETRDTDIRIYDEKISGTTFSSNILGHKFENMRISMPGRHQVENAVLALTALEVLKKRGVEMSDEAVYTGMLKAKQIGRFEIIKEEPLIIIDGAHNPDGAKTLRDTMKRFCNNKSIIMVTGMLKDKDTDNIINEFMSITDRFIVTEPMNPRRMTAEELKDKLEAKGAVCESYPDYKNAVRRALEKAANYDCVIFGGSLYLIGMCRTILKQ